jgi:SAM-dependent methyltransferase
MRNKLKNIPFFKYLVIWGRVIRSESSVAFRIRCLLSFFKDYRLYRKLAPNTSYTLTAADLFPRIYDKTGSHKLDPVYFIQGTWCARKVFENKPERHYDIGSQALMVGIISQFTPTTMIDIRPISLTIPNLSFAEGDITKLPFKDNSISSLSSICVIEHIGLGRYGDPLDAFGTEKAAAELSRVLAKDGRLYISVPIDSKNKVYFNAHRAFTRDYVMKLFTGLKLKEESYIYGSGVHETYEPLRGFGTGLYYFTK